MAWSVNISGQGFVHADGQLLRDSTGTDLELHGVNVGGWLLWEGWIWGGKFHSEKRIMSNLTKLTDAETAEDFQDQVHHGFINFEDIQEISTLGFNCIRLPFNHEVVEPTHPDGEYRFQYLDSALAWCKTAGLYLILDLHAAPGGQSPLFISDPDRPNLWKESAYQDAMVRIWYEIASRYANEPIIAGYDLLNEPNTNDDQALIDLYRRTIDTIRLVDSNHLLIIEGNKYARKFELFTEPLDSNMMFSFHFYPWFKGTKGQAKLLASYAEFGVQMKTPMWCGEWGEDKLNDLEAIGQGLTAEDYAFAGTAFWTWKKVVKSAHPALNAIIVPDDLRRLIAGKRPRTDDSEYLLAAFQSAWVLSNTTRSDELADIFIHIILQSKN